MLKPINFTVDEFEISPLKGDDIERFDAMAEEVYTILSDEQTLKFIPEKRLNNKDEGLQWLQISLLNFHSGRNYIHLIRSKLTGKIVGIIDILSPNLVRQHYKLSSYPYFFEFYMQKEFQGGSLMSKILPGVLDIVKKQNIHLVAAAADRNNFAARKVLERSGFTNIMRFDSTKDFFQVIDKF